MLDDEAETQRRQLRAVRYTHALLLEDLAHMTGIRRHRLLAFETGRSPDFSEPELARLQLVIEDLAPVRCPSSGRSAKELLSLDANSS